MVRRTTTVLVVFLCALAPVLACWPSASMTDAEMACCQRMAGNCEMGGGNHSCCKTAMNVAQPAAAIVQSPQIHLPAVVMTAATVFADRSADRTGESVRLAGLPTSISPPGLLSILRI